MRCTRLLPLLPGLLLGFGTFAQESTPDANTFAASGDLERVLTAFAIRCRVPMLIEIAEPVARGLHAEATSCELQPFLNQVIGTNPNYAFDIHGRAVHVYDRTVVQEKNNFLNWKLKEFKVQKNVAEFENILIARLWALRSGTNSSGMLIHGIYPTDLSKRSLPSRVYSNSTAREILLDVEDLDGTFLSVIVFPKRQELVTSDLDAVFASWQWRSMAVSDPPK